MREFTLTLPLLVLLTCLAWNRSRPLGYTAALISIVFAGALLDTAHRPPKTPIIDARPEETVVLSGCISEPPVFYEGRDQFMIDLAPGAGARVSLAIRDGESPPDLRYGQRVELDARVRQLRGFHNPAAFDYPLFAARKGIYWNASMRPGSPVRVLPGRCGSRFFAAVFWLRTAALQRIERVYANDPYSTGLMEATLVGATSKVEKIWTEDFRKTGTYHALVIAGLHVTVLAGVLLFLMRMCFIPRMQALIITAVAAWMYAFVSGWNAPVVRAAAGFTLYTIARYFYRRGRVLNLLAAVAFAYLFFDPSQLFDAGFQLSFLSVAAIAVLAAPIMEATSGPLIHGLQRIDETPGDPRLPPRVAGFRVELRLLAETASYYVRLPVNAILFALAYACRAVLFMYDMAVISATMQIGLALPMAIYFHRVSFSGVSANVIVVPLLSLAVPVGFAAILTGWHWIAAIGNWLLFASAVIARWHLRWEPDWRIPDPPLWLSLAFTAALLGLAFVIRARWRWRWPVVAAVAVTFALVVRHPFPPSIVAGSMELTAIDVGQGDGLLAAFPDGKLMLIDGGGIPSFGKKTKSKIDIGEDVISPYLWSRSIRRVDVVVATHAHEDHTGGLGALIDNFHPSELWTGANPPSPVWDELAAHARRRGVKIVPMRAGRAFKYGGATIEVLSPPPEYSPGDSPMNNDSLVLRIAYGERSFLLTGDLEAPLERGLVESGALRHVDVLKVGHHGSKTSSTEPFLEALRPEFAVISDGFENSFHHPHPSVLARLSAHHAEILRTDRDGLITIRTDGHSMSVQTYYPAVAVQSGSGDGSAR